MSALAIKADLLLHNPKTHDGVIRPDETPATFGKLGEVRILVHADDIDRARQLIESRENYGAPAGDGPGDAQE